MKNIKTYEDFVNEEINLRKGLMGAALGASLMSGIQSCDTKPSESEIYYARKNDEYDRKEKVDKLYSDAEYDLQQLWSNGTYYGKVPVILKNVPHGYKVEVFSNLSNTYDNLCKNCKNINNDITRDSVNIFYVCDDMRKLSNIQLSKYIEFYIDFKDDEIYNYYISDEFGNSKDRSSVYSLSDKYQLLKEFSNKPNYIKMEIQYNGGPNGDLRDVEDGLKSLGEELFDESISGSIYKSNNAGLRGLYLPEDYYVYLKITKN